MKYPIVKATADPNPSALELANRALARKAAAEGFVLLENDGVLPLQTKKIALYGSGARKTVKGGTGSGAVRERYSVTIEQGLQNAGLEITTGAWLDRFDKFYADAYHAYEDEVEEKVKDMRNFYQILHAAGKFEHPTGIPVTEADIAESATDTAIYILARQAGEGFDREDKIGDYRLDEIETANLQALSAAYKNFIVVINAGGVIDVGFLDTLHVSALVYYVQGGEEGGNALADLLTGKENFSGKLATGWTYKFEDIPSNSTYSYRGGDAHNQEYNEGIYLGYRYFDTFGVAPRYHFGYGLSYTTFALSAAAPTLNGGTVEMEITVQNTGSCPGREVAQLYATVPFGETGAEYQRLVAFGKTPTLAHGESVALTLTIPLRELCSYDEAQAAFVLRAGQYVLRLGNASHTAKPAALLTLAAEARLEQCVNICPPQHEIKEITPPPRPRESLQGLPTLALPTDLPCITHEYPETPVYSDNSVQQKIESLTVEQLATLVCGGGTSAEGLQVEAMGASGTTTPKLFESAGIPNIILSDGPAGLNLTPQIVEMPDGSYRSARVPEVLEAYKRYLFGFAKIGLMSKMAAPEDGTVHYQYATAWPCSQLLAQTFDTELLRAVGDAVGGEMEAFGVSVWLAPGMNLHRNPLCGRTFEYYSEDPYLSGKLAAAMVRGVQSHPGKSVSVKHFAANNCELERNASSSNMTERALRELYLHGFEIAVKESAPDTVMAAYNLINGVYCTNNRDLLVKLLRNEWGFGGLVMSDWDAMKADREDCTKPATANVQKAPAAQCDLVMPGRPDQIEALVKGVESGTVSIDDLRRAAGRVLRLIRKNTVLESE